MKKSAIISFHLLAEFTGIVTDSKFKNCVRAGGIGSIVARH